MIAHPSGGFWIRASVGLLIHRTFLENSLCENQERSWSYDDVGVVHVFEGMSNVEERENAPLHGLVPGT